MHQIDLKSISPLFADTIKLLKDDESEINMTGKGIAWESDKKYKFRNPEVPADYKNLTLCKIINRNPTFFIVRSDFVVQGYNLMLMAQTLCS